MNFPWSPEGDRPGLHLTLTRVGCLSWGSSAQKGGKMEASHTLLMRAVGQKSSQNSPCDRNCCSLCKPISGDHTVKWGEVRPRTPSTWPLFVQLQWCVCVCSPGRDCWAGGSELWHCSTSCQTGNGQTPPTAPWQLQGLKCFRLWGQGGLCQRGISPCIALYCYHRWFVQPLSCLNIPLGLRSIDKDNY